MTEKESWEHCLKVVNQVQSNTFLCVEIVRLDADGETKNAMLSKVKKAIAAMGRKPGFCNTTVMQPSETGGIEYGKLIRSAFCRRMIHECE